ncbi:MAG: class I SAM-dependent methyltransferase [Acidobacteria bacterium]|nr:class I SAM-dependent methyltransferase [Acidobacteriota bacterium]
MKEIFSYDVMPYPSKFFLQTHPDRLATLATFFGMTPAPVESCRVLELGCGNGSNLISHAYNLPDARFVGVDLAENHITDAKRAAAGLDLSNVEFYRMDVTAMTAAEFGRFDYIIAHGLFSWVPDFVRERVLELCREMLSDAGVGYISYSAFPGAHQRQMVQKMLRYHARHFDEPLDKVGKSISFLAFLAENATEKEVYAPVLQSELKRHFEHDAADIFHDDLSDVNRAFYFHEFAALLEKNRLRYLAEAELHAMGTGSLSPDAREFVESLDSIVEREQYLDFLRGRIFRQTLFCREEVALNHQPEPAVMREFKLASSVRPQSAAPELAAPARERFVGMKGVGIEIDHPLTKAALVILGESWGRTIPFPELVERAKERIAGLGFETENWDEQIYIASAILLQICRGTSLIELHLFQPAAAAALAEKPRVNRLAQWQLPQADNVLTLLNLDVRVEDEVSRHLLEICDGTRGKDELLAGMRRFIEESDDVDDRETLLKDLPEWLDESLAQLARLGMFS